MNRPYALELIALLTQWLIRSSNPFPFFLLLDLSLFYLFFSHKLHLFCKCAVNRVKVAKVKWKSTACAMVGFARELSRVLKRASSLYSARTIARKSLVNLALRSVCVSSCTTFVQGDDDLLECSEAAIEDCKDVLVVPEFISAEEGESLLHEINRTLRGKRFLYNHWDGVGSLLRMRVDKLLYCRLLKGTERQRRRNGMQQQT